MTSQNVEQLPARECSTISGHRIWYKKSAYICTALAEVAYQACLTQSRSLLHNPAHHVLCRTSDGMNRWKHSYHLFIHVVLSKLHRCLIEHVTVLFVLLYALPYCYIVWKHIMMGWLCVLLYSITARLCEVIFEGTTECTPLLLHCIVWGDDLVCAIVHNYWYLVSHDGVTLPRLSSEESPAIYRQCLV